ncbi:MAG: polysaccharide deacetylase [Verrucomicrobia bacterium]|nr:polysaccharide deacetylase [Verrucomicrobiota bacterium]
MYHSISDDPETGVHPYFKVCTSPRRFGEQMQWLADQGCRGVTLSEGLAHLAPETEDKENDGGKKPVAITFDDGFRDFATAAFPALQRHGFSATMYLPTAFVSEERKHFKDRECLTWGEVRELRNAGAEFGSHTVNHPRLVQLGWPAIEAELRDSRTDLEQRLGAGVDHFAYPYAFPQAEKEFARRFSDLLRTAGYRTNVTTMIERADSQSDRLALPRLPANSDDDHELFTAKLAGAYDWMGSPQAVTKAVARWVRPGSRPVAIREKSK